MSIFDSRDSIEDSRAERRDSTPFPGFGFKTLSSGFKTLFPRLKNVLSLLSISFVRIKKLFSHHTQFHRYEQSLR